MLRRMRDLALLLRKKRFKRGALELTMPEPVLEYDADGRVSGAHFAEQNLSHQIVEEFMLAANIAVATKLNDLEVGFLRRVHAEPDSLKLQSLAKFVATLGFKVGESQPPQREPQRTKDKSKGNRKSQISNLKSKASPFDSPAILSKAELQKLLKDVAGTPSEHAVNYALLRSLRQAEYSGVPIGHYALAVSEYCHFTSPIRRYPDLTIHRLFDDFCSGNTLRGMSDTELEILGSHCSDTERRAAQAERELTKIKLLAFMAERIGDEFDAIITGVERFGLFCKGEEMPVDGFVHITTLSEQDYFDFDPASVSLIGRRTGNQFRLGDKVRVQVAFVNVDRRELDFRLASSQARRRPKSRDAEAGANRPSKPARSSRPGKRPPKPRRG